MKYVATIALTLMMAGASIPTALAANSDNGPGCGLGKLAWGDYKRQKDIAPQVLMATTNGTFWSQTFGISFGTSGCTNDGKVWAEDRTNVFVASTFDSLTSEIAKGEGEHLASLATMMGVPAEQHQQFFALAQERYEELVRLGETSPTAIIKALGEAMAGHRMLAHIVSTR
jgi:Protein of unknown function (DUF3015)